MKIRLRYIAVLFVTAIVAWVAAMKCWPQQIRVLGEAANSRELKLAIWKNGGFEEIAFTPDGRAAVGKGAWRAPWQDGGRIVAVYDDKTMYWEGAIAPPVVGSVSITLSEGRPLAINDKQTGEHAVRGNRR